MGNVCGAPAAAEGDIDLRTVNNERPAGQRREHEPAPVQRQPHAHAHAQPRIPAVARDRARDWATTLATWGKTYPAVTRSELLRRREEFWGTRVEGRPEMWQAIRLSAESGDDGTAQVILESAGLTPYDIDRADACYCYDLKGFRYDIPLFLLYEPRTLVSDEKAAAMAAPKPVVNKLSAEDAKRMDKTIAFRARFSDSRVPDIILSFVGRTTLAAIKAWVEEHTGIPVPCQQLFYQGRRLPDTDTVVSAQIRSGQVIQFMIRPLRDANGDAIPFQLKPNIVAAPPIVTNKQAAAAATAAAATAPQATAQNNIRITSADEDSLSQSSISSSSSRSSLSSRSSRRTPSHSSRRHVDHTDAATTSVPVAVQ